MQSPMLRLEADTLSENMTRCLGVLDRACEQLATVRRLHDSVAAPVIELCGMLEDKAKDFPTLALGLGLKGAKFTKASDNLAWNVRVIRGALRQLVAVKEEADTGLWVVSSLAARRGCEVRGLPCDSQALSGVAGCLPGDAQALNQHGRLHIHRR